MVLAVRAKSGWTEMPTSGPSGQCCPLFSSSRYALALKKPTSASGSSTCQPSAVVCIGTSRQEAPAGHGANGVGGDDFAAAGIGAAEVGAQAGGPVFLSGQLFGVPHGETNFVAGKAQ